eukprot:CAMPEP_0197020494 /NCGR_PEP_ID=MMETSP1384-20130603/1295_1 /TAXON_ID=29189 /ORGANISM="Ammonia sp." /LENGTH=185 /DNA_ID=CAMNT_0042448127 /DNA_START=31 /DNA_END=588 /DNA_ORIENTATION=+
MAQAEAGQCKSGQCGHKGGRTRGRDMVYPIFGVLLNALVVGQAMQAVGKCRHKYQIKAPSIEPHDDMKEEEKQEWRRTYRAQVNSVEWFSLTSPVFIAGSMIGKKAFGEYGKYVPRFLGACSILNAYFRYKYVKAYQEQADARAPYFHRITAIARPAIMVAMSACVYLIYQDVKCVVSKYRSKSN